MFSHEMKRDTRVGTCPSIQLLGYGLSKHAGVVLRGNLTTTPKTEKSNSVGSRECKNGAERVFLKRYGSFLAGAW